VEADGEGAVLALGEVAGVRLGDGHVEAAGGGSEVRQQRQREEQRDAGQDQREGAVAQLLLTQKMAAVQINPPGCDSLRRLQPARRRPARRAATAPASSGMAAASRMPNGNPEPLPPVSASATGPVAAEGLALGEADAAGLTPAVGLGEGEADGDGLGEALGDGEGDGAASTVTVSVELLLVALVSPLKLSLKVAVFWMVDGAEADTATVMVKLRSPAALIPAPEFGAPEQVTIWPLTVQGRPLADPVSLT
jgi:hypothetical protein